VKENGQRMGYDIKALVVLSFASITVGNPSGIKDNSPSLSFLSTKNENPTTSL